MFMNDQIRFYDLVRRDICTIELVAKITYCSAEFTGRRDATPSENAMRTNTLTRCPLLSQKCKLIFHDSLRGNLHSLESSALNWLQQSTPPKYADLCSTTHVQDNLLCRALRHINKLSCMNIEFDPLEGLPRHSRAFNAALCALCVHR